MVSGPNANIGISRIVGVKPRPRVLVVGRDLPEGVVEEIERLAPTVLICDDLVGIRR